MAPKAEATGIAADAHGHGAPGHSGLLSVEDALDRLLAAIDSPLEPEAVPVSDGFGRVLAEPVRAATDLPPWDNSAMDGYAVRSADVASAGAEAPVRLEVRGEVRAGSPPSIAVEAGSAVRIATGAPLPPGADAVVPVEDTTPVDVSGTATARSVDASGTLPVACLVHVAVAPRQHVRSRGDDVRRGDQVISAGRLLSPANVTLAAGVGQARLQVRRRPVVGVLSTGDELRVEGEPLGPAGIPDANRPGLIALVRASGGVPLDLGVARDELPAVVDALRRGLAEADALVVSGGVSVGPYDVVRAAFAELGSVGLWRVAVQPGKPFAFGTALAPDRGASSTSRTVLLFGLPGNPVSVFVTFELFVRPALDRLSGLDGIRGLASPAEYDAAVLVEAVGKAPGRRAFLRVRAERDQRGARRRDERGRVPVRLAGGQGSHALSALSAADGLAIVAETTDHLDAGSEVPVYWLSGR